MAGRATGVWMRGTGELSLESVTIQGAKTGVRAAVSGSEIRLNRVRLERNENGMDSTGGHIVAREILMVGPWTEDNPDSLGAVAQEGFIEIEDSTLQSLGTHLAAIAPNAKISIKRSVILGPSVETAQLSSCLVTAMGGGVVDVEESTMSTTQAVANVESSASSGTAKAASGTIHIAKSEIAQLLGEPHFSHVSMSAMTLGGSPCPGGMTEPHGAPGLTLHAIVDSCGSVEQGLM